MCITHFLKSWYHKESINIFYHNWNSNKSRKRLGNSVISYLASCAGTFMAFLEFRESFIGSQLGFILAMYDNFSLVLLCLAVELFTLTCAWHLMGVC